MRFSWPTFEPHLNNPAVNVIKPTPMTSSPAIVWCFLYRCLSHNNVIYHITPLLFITQSCWCSDDVTTTIYVMFSIQTFITQLCLYSDIFLFSSHFNLLLQTHVSGRDFRIVLNCVRLARNGTNLGLFKTSFSTFWNLKIKSGTF